MDRRMSESILRRSLGAALLLALPLLAGCGVQNRANPFAPVISPSSQSGSLAEDARASKPNKGKGQGAQNKTQTSSGTTSGKTTGGVTSGNFGNPSDGEPNEPLVIE
jgi:hypothetical protein